MKQCYFNCNVLYLIIVIKILLMLTFSFMQLPLIIPMKRTYKNDIERNGLCNYSYCPTLITLFNIDYRLFGVLPHINKNDSTPKNAHKWIHSTNTYKFDTKRQLNRMQFFTTPRCLIQNVFDNNIRMSIFSKTKTKNKQIQIIVQFLIGIK